MKGQGDTTALRRWPRGFALLGLGAWFLWLWTASDLAPDPPFTAKKISPAARPPPLEAAEKNGAAHRVPRIVFDQRRQDAVQPDLPPESPSTAPQANPAPPEAPEEEEPHSPRQQDLETFAGWDTSVEGAAELDTVFLPCPQPLPAPTEVEYYRTTRAASTTFYTRTSGPQPYRMQLAREAASVGILVRLQSADYVLIYHDEMSSLEEDPTRTMLTPAGKAPFASGGSHPFAALTDMNALALFYPNQGESLYLAPGTYSFPLAAFDDRQLYLARSVEVQGYFTEPHPEPTELALNLWVLEGSGEIFTLAQAENHPVILGSVAQLCHLFQQNPQVAIPLNIELGLIPDAELAVVESTFDQAQIQANYPPAEPRDGINVYLVRRILGKADGGSFADNTLGLASHTPGPFHLAHTPNSGILAVFISTGEGHALGTVIAHEIGHFLGLFHTTEFRNLSEVVGADPIEDTPHCAAYQAHLPEKYLQCADWDNLMFPFYSAGAKTLKRPTLTPQQGRILRLNPLVGWREGDGAEDDDER